MLAVSAVVLGAALVSQYWGGLAPCELCLLQRWPWGVAITISLVTVLAGGRAGAAVGRGGSGARVRRQRGLRLLSSRGRAEVVRGTERLHRERHRRDDPGADEAADSRAAPVCATGCSGRCSGYRWPAGTCWHRCSWPRSAPRAPASAATGIAGGGSRMKAQRPPYLPGDPPAEADIAPMIRVDHAGEYGAVRIYEGQLAVIGRGRARDEIRRMAEQEKRHLAEFDEVMRTRRVRPTALQPVWHVAGFLLGAATALLGEQAAMACTVAVEEVIDEHYREQAERLGDDDPALRTDASRIPRRRTGAPGGRDRARRAPKRRLRPDLGAVKTGSRLAIWLSTRI